MRCYYLTVLVLILAASAIAADYKASEYNDVLSTPDQSLRVHRAGNLALSVTNYGVIGSYARTIYDPETGTPAPCAEYPANSEIDYLFLSMIWIGAVVEDQENPGVFDTLVSIGADGWWYNIREFMPAEYGIESIWRDRYIADDEIYAEFYDTNVIASVDDPVDERPHIPLGLKINQHSYCWSSPGYNDFIIIDYYLTNIYDRELHDVWFGFYWDGDVFHSSESPYGPEEGAQDDLSGLVHHNGLDIGWVADNNGQPYNGIFTDSSGTSVMGATLIHASTPDLQTNFNWWAHNSNSVYDWGPSWIEHERIFGGGGRGTPGGDVSKYFVMSNGEQDYDWAFSALDWTDNGWSQNHSQTPTDLADGYDTRYLLSWGAFDLVAGATETLRIAIVAGSDFHTDPDNFANNLQGHTDDSLSIVEYYNNLNFSNLFANIDTIANYEADFTGIPIGYPSNFRVAVWSDSVITLTWSLLTHPALNEYRIYRGTQSGVYDPVKITPDGFTDSIFYDTDVDDNTNYFYIICSVNSNDIQGINSPEVFVNSGQPLTPRGLEADGYDGAINLNWLPNDEADIAGYVIYRNSYHEPDDVFVIVDTTSETQWHDYSISPGMRYNYLIRALDTAGNLSDPTDTVSALAISIEESRVLLVNSNRAYHNPDYEMMVQFYYELLENSQRDFTIINRPPESLIELANYSTLVWCSELYSGQFDAYQYFLLLADYLDAGGKLILAGPMQITLSSFDSRIQFNMSDFAYNYLNLNGLDYPPIHNTEFIGGRAVDTFFPNFDLDTARVNRIVFPSGENDGRLFGMGYIEPRDSTEIIYNYQAVEPETSYYHDEPIGIIHHADNYSIAYLEFPLYYIEQETAFGIFNRVLEAMEYVDIDEPVANALPEKTSLLYNYPNPFNARTQINYELSHTADVSIAIYDILGRRLQDITVGRQEPGLHAYTWDARELPSGIYFYRLRAGDDKFVRKCMIIK